MSDKPNSDETNRSYPPRLSTGFGGQPAEAVDKSPEDLPDDPALAALQRAKRGGRDGRHGTPKGRATRRDNLRGRGRPGAERGGYSGPAPDETDPQLLGSVLSGYIGERGWERPLSQARVFADWAGLVGADIAAHSTPNSLRDGELRVSAESTAWATQLRLMASGILARLAAELGPDVVTKIIFVGPSAPSWTHGRWSVRGRGVRDTYG